MHARLPKNFVLEERMERHADALEVAPRIYQGLWAQACAPAGGAPFGSVKLDLGCGKGCYLVECARQEPDTLWIGVDSEPVCAVYAAQAVLESGVRNAVIVPGRADNLASFVAPSELAALHINFPTPFPQKKRAAGRVTNLERLLEYRELLAPGAALTLRTDSQPLFDFSVRQLAGAGYDTVWASDDTRRDHPEIPDSEYERKLSAEGATVYGIRATVGAMPSERQLAAARELPQSLFDYLPENLFEGDYIPHGMSYAITVMRNRRANAELRAASRAK